MSKKFLPDCDDNEIIYWEDEWIYYKFPNKITENNMHEAERFDVNNNTFTDFSWKTIDEIVDYCFSDNQSFWHKISKKSYDNAKNWVLEQIKRRNFRYIEESMVDKINELKWPKACIDNWVIKIWNKTIGTIWEGDTLYQLQRETMLFISWIIGKYERERREKYDSDLGYFEFDPFWIRDLKGILRRYPYN